MAKLDEPDGHNPQVDRQYLFRLLLIGWWIQLIRGEVVIGDRTVNLTNITMPVLNWYAEIGMPKTIWFRLLHR